MDTKQINIQGTPITVRMLDQKQPGFMPRWRQILALKRAVQDINRAQPEDVDLAVQLLADHLMVPADAPSKARVLDAANADEFTLLFETILGMNSVPPSNGAPSAT